MLSWLRRWLCGYGSERPSPGPWIPWSDMRLEGERLVVELLPDVRHRLLGVGNSGSEDPVMDDGSMCLMYEVKDNTPLTPEQLIVGDIACYRHPDANYLIRHRIVEKGWDELGRYFRFKGDNNSKKDKWKVRSDAIEWVVVLISYGVDDV